MDFIKNIFIDSLNGLAISQIPLYLFQLLCAALGGYVLQLIVNKKWGDVLLKYSALVATAVAVMASISKYSLPIAVLGAGAILLLVNRKPNYQFETVGQLLIVLIGVGCGVGSVVQTMLGAFVLCLLLLFTPIRKENA